MITEKQKQIMKVLINSKEGYNINQIAKLTGLSASWTYETLKLLEKQGYLTAVKLGNAVYFRINWQDLKAQKITELILLEEKFNPQKKTYAVNPGNLEIEGVKTGNITVSEPATNEIRNDFYNTKVENNPGNFSYSKVTSSNFSYSNQSAGFYGVVQAGPQGVNSMLAFYAQSGAFGASPYSGIGNTRNTAVPPDTLGSRISGNVSAFTLRDHTTSHASNSVDGCKYFGPNAKVI